MVTKAKALDACPALYLAVWTLCPLANQMIIFRIPSGLRKQITVDDETIRLILTVLQLLGHDSTPRQVEQEYLKTKGVVEDYRKSISGQPETDPKRS